MDQAIVMLLNSLTGKSWALDTAVNLMVRSDVIKGCLVVAIFMFAWFWRINDQSTDDIRQRLIASLVGTMIALAVARLLVVALPFKTRPMNDPALAFVVHFGVDPQTIRNDATFPSDHAALFFGLATGIFTISRRGGIIIPPRRELDWAGRTRPVSLVYCLVRTRSSTRKASPLTAPD